VDIHRRDEGFTLIELMVTIVLASILMATAVWSFNSYLRASQHSGSATEVRSVLRNASERALSEGRTYCVYFEPPTRSYTVYRSRCDVATNSITRFETAGPAIVLANVAFPPPSPAIPNQVTACPAAGACAYFYPRGTAVAGTLEIRRTGSLKVYTISVEGLTSRVTLV